ncbi:MAG: transposase [Paludibacteraceae bacterium]
MAPLSVCFKRFSNLIAAIYKLRWQIELLFKPLKQNFPLKYFLGEYENTIKIQIYCALIVNLLLTVVQKQFKCSWSSSDLVSFAECICSITNIRCGFWRIWRKTGLETGKD